MLINLFDTEMANPTNKLNEELNKKFISKDKFAEDIEALVLNTKMNYIDAIVEYCEQNSIEIESVSKLVSKPLKEKLKCNATELNFMRKTTRGKLPL
jgi:ribosomal protein L11